MNTVSVLVENVENREGIRSGLDLVAEIRNKRSLTL
jgi:hypothetical protein